MTTTYMFVSIYNFNTISDLLDYNDTYQRPTSGKALFWPKIRAKFNFIVYHIIFT